MALRTFFHGAAHFYCIFTQSTHRQQARNGAIFGQLVLRSTGIFFGNSFFVDQLCVSTFDSRPVCCQQNPDGKVMREKHPQMAVTEKKEHIQGSGTIKKNNCYIFNDVD